MHLFLFSQGSYVLIPEILELGAPHHSGKLHLFNPTQSHIPILERNKLEAHDTVYEMP